MPVEIPVVFNDSEPGVRRVIIAAGLYADPVLTRASSNVREIRPLHTDVARRLVTATAHLAFV